MTKKAVSILMASILLFGVFSLFAVEVNADEFTVGVSLLTREHEFYRDLEEGLEDAAAEHGISLNISSANFDLADQMSQVENFVAQGVDAIIVSPVDSEGVVTAIDSANQAGIPVFTADISAAGGDVVSHIASNNVAGGRMAGQYIADRLNYSGNIAIIDHPYISSIIDRTDGFMEIIDMYPELQVVARPDGGAVRGQAMDAAEDVLIANEDLDAFFGVNDDSALGALAATEAAGRDDEIIIVGYDATPEAQEAIRANTALKADPVQFPYDIGQITIQTISQHLDGEEVPEVIDVEMEIYYKAVLDYMDQSN